MSTDADVMRKCAAFLHRRASGIRARASGEPGLHECFLLHAAIAAQALDDAAESMTLQAALMPAAPSQEVAVQEAHAALLAAGWVGRGDLKARQERPDAPVYDNRTVQGVLMAAEMVRNGEKPGASGPA